MVDYSDGFLMIGLMGFHMIICLVGLFFAVWLLSKKPRLTRRHLHALIFFIQMYCLGALRFVGDEASPIRNHVLSVVVALLCFATIVLINKTSDRAEIGNGLKPASDEPPDPCLASIADAGGFVKEP